MTLARRHAQWAADWPTARRRRRRAAPGRSQWLAEYMPEFENARFAIEWALSHDEVILAARVATTFSRVSLHLGMHAGLRGWLDAVLDRLDADAQPELAARAWNQVGSSTSGSLAIEAAQHAVELSERCNDPVLTVGSLSGLALWLSLGGRLDEAQVVSDRALQLANEKGATRRFIRVDALMGAGTVAYVGGHFDEALQLYGEGLGLATAQGNEVIARAFRVNIAEIEYKIGNTARALELVSEIKSEAGRDPIRLCASGNSAAYKIALGDIAGARIDARETLRLARGADWFASIGAIEHIASVAALGVDPRRGARLRGYVDAAHSRVGNKRGPADARSYEILMTALREKLTDAEIDALGAEGAQLSEDQAVAEALAV